MHYFLPRKGEALFAAGSELLQQEDDGFEDAAMENGKGLPGYECLLIISRLVLGSRARVLPIDEGLIGYEWVILVFGYFKVPQELEVFEWHETLILVELANDIFQQAIN
jgi:hypothetical protein